MNKVLLSINKALAHYKYIVIGELHGVQENISLLEEILAEYADASDQTVAFALEWPLSDEENRVLNDYVSGEADANDEAYTAIIDKLYQQQSGVFSDQHMNFLEKVRDCNTQKRMCKIQIIAFDPDIDSWNERDKQMADRIVENGKDAGTVFVTTGSLHGCKQPFRFEGGGDLYEPLASHLPGKQTFSIKLQYENGQFYNFGMQHISPSDEKDNDEMYYDAVYSIEEATPVTIIPCNSSDT